MSDNFDWERYEADFDPGITHIGKPANELTDEEFFARLDEHQTDEELFGVFSDTDYTINEKSKIGRFIKASALALPAAAFVDFIEDGQFEPMKTLGLSLLAGLATHMYCQYTEAIDARLYQS